METRPAGQRDPQAAVLGLLLSFWHWKAVWISSTVLFTCLGILYAALIKRDVWVASQGMIVRDEATATAMRLGRFESQTQMKTAQETLMELARNPRVIRTALESVPAERSSGAWPWSRSQAGLTPSAREVESFGKKNVTVRAPHGAELGTTEIIYLDIKQTSPERAVRLAQAIGCALETQLQQVRRHRAEGIIEELKAAEVVAQTELQHATRRLQQMEVEAGADLADLRGLTDANTGSTNRLMLDMVRDDLRRGEIELQMHSENLESARAAIDNPKLLSQVTDRLVDTQPTIKKLREALAEASIRTTQQMGRYSESHPEVLIARQTEQRVTQRLMEELEATISAIESSIARTKRRMTRLGEQEQELGKRLNRLANIRADYTNVVAEVRSRSEELHQIRRDLTQALAARDAASTSSLITRLDEPVLGERPLGPGRSTLVAAAFLGGLFLGLGIVFLIIPMEHPKTVTSDSHSAPDAGSSRRPEIPQPDSVNLQPSAEPSLPSPALEYEQMFPVIATPMTTPSHSAKI